jgi:SpoVK/Ycf46/Vps4 family AAA+-type ATPase
LMVTGIKYKYKEYMLHMRAIKQAKKSGGDTVVGTTKQDLAYVAVPKDDVGTGMILFDSVPDDYLEMAWPAVVGFSFTSKTWGEVLVDGLSEIEFDETVFENLVLPAARKRMVKALVRHSNDAFNDIISGKGEGSVFLLYGPPGCGKTLTAEAISEMLHRPLYTVSLGQLGVTPSELETKLNEILDLCGRWDALILLDEADIFLEKRSSTGSLERNAMVSVMLRLVEYFKGVLFLTSNRVDALDPAFKTRITLALRYEPLSYDARMTVWTNLLALSGYAPSIQDGTIDVTVLAEHVLNGREIKNAIRLGMALAEEDRVPLNQELLAETIDTLNDFNEKMKSAEAY